MEEKLEEVVEETTQQINQGDPGDEHVEKVDESKFESAGDDNIIKVDLSKPPTPKEEKNEKPEENTEVETSSTDDSGVVAESKDAEPAQEQEEIQPEAETQETPVLEEITEEEVEEQVEEIAEEANEAIKENLETGKPLPENIQKLMDFMEETGGDLNDYVKLNQDYSNLNDEALLKEYYAQTKPHLNNEEINFLMEDQFSYDEEVDEDRDIRRKKLALKEQVANAKSHLDGQKSKYYEEIKAGSKLTSEQQKAVDFFNRYNKESEETKKVAEAQKSTFLNKTENVFNDKFKGFEYNVGDKKYRFNVNNAKEVKDTQSDINNFVKKFLNKKNEMSDAKGYHKSLYTAMNADAVANHFYEQGKADALKDSVAKAKNVDMNPRQSHGEIEAGGMKFKVLGDNSSDFKFKIKNKNK
jgi:hypothetical protein